MKDKIVNFLLTGDFEGLRQNYIDSRMPILRRFGEMKGFNKKGGVYAALYKDNIFYYVGHGSIGRLAGIRITNITEFELDYGFILKLLQEHRIPFQYRSPYVLSLNKYNMYLHFADIETNDLLCLNEIIQSHDSEVVKILSLLKV